MRTFPIELQQARPVPADVLPDRPWWQKGVWPVNDADYADLRPSRFRRMDGRLAVTLEEVADIDKNFPLPHPGFRVGQVWGHQWDNGLYVVRTIIGHYPMKPHIMPSIWQITGIYNNQPEPMPTTHELEKILSNAFLLADPACPHLAPWAPAE